jgi:hypothetical protein
MMASPFDSCGRFAIARILLVVHLYTPPQHIPLEHANIVLQPSKWQYSSVTS